MSGEQAPGIARILERECGVAHLLLIDDDPELVPEKVRHLFPSPAHRVEVANTGSEGLKCIAAAPPDVFPSICAYPTSRAWRS